MLWDPSKDIDLNKPSLKGLAYLLRHKELWPEDFRWEWSTCDKCAMGLACQYWPQIRKGTFFNLFKPSHLGSMMKGLGIGKCEAYTIFYNNPGMPEQIADVIDRVIASRGGTNV